MRAKILVVLAAAVLTTAATPAADPPRIPTPPTALLETREEKAHCTRAGAEINHWVKKLRLEDWKIELVCGIPEIPEWANSIVHGASRADATTRSATVWINPRSSKKPGEIVVHELLHLVMAEVRESKSNLIEERAVWLLGELLSGSD